MRSIARIGAAGGAFVLSASVLPGCGGGACEKAVDELAALRVETIRAAPADVLAPMRATLDRARSTCAGEKRETALERVSEVEHAIMMRSADLAIEAGQKALASATASAAPPPPPVWNVGCAELVDEGGFFGLLPPGIPKEAAPRLVSGATAPVGEAAAKPDAGASADAGVGADAGPPPAPDDALVLGGSPVYLSGRGGKLEGAKLEGGAFTVQQALPFPASVAEEGATVTRIVAARGPDELLGVAWVSDLRAFFGVLDTATERWTVVDDLPVSGDDGGRDLVIGDLAWGRASFGLTLSTATGFAVVEVLPTARAVRPASLVRAHVAGIPRIAWGGDRFVIAAGRPDGAPSMGLWLAPDGARPATWLTLVGELPAGSRIEPLTGDLVAKDGQVHLGFRVVSSGGAARRLLGHAAGSVAGLDECK